VAWKVSPKKDETNRDESKAGNEKNKNKNKKKKKKKEKDPICNT
jgi:hypothetical protein